MLLPGRASRVTSASITSPSCNFTSRPLKNKEQAGSGQTVETRSSGARSHSFFGNIVGEFRNRGCSTQLECQPFFAHSGM
jgi:hypothetical protein